MVSITVDKKQIDRLEKALGDKAKNIKRELTTAINATAKKVTRAIAKEITQELATPIKVVAATIRQTRKAKKTELGATVTLSKTKRISLKEFGAKRRVGKGVSYRISKSKGRKTIPSAFIVDKLGGHVFKRVGKSRLPIDKKYGPSPWGVFVKNPGMRPAVVSMANIELKKQIERRIRFRTLQSTGAI